MDHPRLCGEKPIVPATKKGGIGSPPPMRGKENVIKTYTAETRITPAYAGKRFSAPFCSTLYQDHPRLCGEKTLIFFMINSSMGSPPPMRGKERFMVGNTKIARITPAYAGKSFSVKICLFGNKDHPRLCGEKVGRGNYIFFH